MQPAPRPWCCVTSAFPGCGATWTGGGDPIAGIDPYRWNTAASGAFWEALGHLEVVLRNVLADRLADRHAALGRPGSWLDDPVGELDHKAQADIQAARQRVSAKKKDPSDGQTRLHLFRNRLAHHERIWTEPLTDRYNDILTLLGYVDPAPQAWVREACRIPTLLAACPIARPHP